MPIPLSPRRAAASLTGLLALAALPTASADVFEWEYVNGNPFLEKQRSTTLAAGGAGVNAVPGANLSGRDLTTAYLIGADLTAASFRGTTLAHADLERSFLVNADFTDAVITDANFNYTATPLRGFTKEQLYSTASHRAKELGAIRLGRNDLRGWDFGGQNLARSSFENADLADANLAGADLRDATLQVSNLSGASLRGSNLTNAYLPGVTLSGADLSGADARGAIVDDAALAGATTTNLIRPDGRVAGLNLTGGVSLLVRDYDGNPTVHPFPGPLPVVIDVGLATDATGRLRLAFEADPWDSLISFAPGIPVDLGGTIELSFTPDVDPASQTGRTFRVFDWTGVSPTGTFDLDTAYVWDVSNLYSTGQVTLVAVPEPCALTAMLTAMLALALRRRRRIPHRVEPARGPADLSRCRLHN